VSGVQYRMPDRSIPGATQRNPGIKRRAARYGSRDSEHRERICLWADIQCSTRRRDRRGAGLDPKTQQFEAIVLPHLDAAYNLARWLLKDDDSAQDAVQDAYLRAFRFFDRLRGLEARPWLLAIVRNTCYTLLDKGRQRGDQVEFDEERDSDFAAQSTESGSGDPALQLFRKIEKARIDEAIERLPPVYREVIVLRELEELAYEEIAQIANVPVGTVMSRLSRGRAMLRERLGRTDREG
jgi:RNA polymerase sigma factor (sigma-70 family)